MDKHFLRRLIVHAHCPRDNPSEAKIRTRRNADNANRDPINGHDNRDNTFLSRLDLRDILDLGNLSLSLSLSREGFKDDSLEFYYVWFAV